MDQQLSEHDMLGKKKEFARKVTELQEFRDVGQMIEFMEGEFIVIGHVSKTQALNGDTYEEPAFVTTYRDFSGIVHEQVLPYSMLEHLMSHNPAFSTVNKIRKDNLDIAGMSKDMEAKRGKFDEQSAKLDAEASELFDVGEKLAGDEPLPDEPLDDTSATNTTLVKRMLGRLGDTPAPKVSLTEGDTLKAPKEVNEKKPSDPPPPMAVKTGIKERTTVKTTFTIEDMERAFEAGVKLSNKEISKVVASIRIKAEFGSFITDQRFRKPD